MDVDPELRRLALGCLLLGYQGPDVPGWLLDALGEGLGGVVLFGSNVGDGSQVANLTARLRAAAGRDVLIALDEEGGDVTRLDTVRGSRSPGNAALGHLDDVDATRAAYAAIGARLAEAGVTVNLAPVADVNSDPRNPVIGVRSFGADAELVARHVAAAVDGLQSTGVAACPKHFPGHGATTTDSHHEVARIDATARELDARELAPFRAGIAAGTRAVMTGHLLVPALDPDHLATVSAAITTGRLRERLGFAGTVVTDALEMRAVAGTIGMVEGFVQALIAGADAIETGALDYPDLVGTIPVAVQEAVESGRLAPERLADAARRTAQLAVPENISRVPDAATPFAGCLEVLGELPPLTAPLVLECRPPGGMASGALPWSLAEPLATRCPGTAAVAMTEQSAWPVTDRDVVLVVRDPHRYEWQQALLRHPATVIVDVGWPSELPGGAPVLRTRGVAPGLLAAAAERLATVK